jgi:hypothetical protein
LWSCNPWWDLFQWYVTCSNQRTFEPVFWLLVVKNRIVNLVYTFFFGHNLCFKSSNKECEHTFNIYVSKLFNNFKMAQFEQGLLSSLLTQIFLRRIRSPTSKMNSQTDSHLGVVGIHFLCIFPHLWDCAWVLKHLEL